MTKSQANSYLSLACVGCCLSETVLAQVSLFLSHSPLFEGSHLLSPDNLFLSPYTTVIAGVSWSFGAKERHPCENRQCSLGVIACESEFEEWG